MHILISEWNKPLEDWPELESLVDSLGQTRWVLNSYFDWHLGRYLYVAESDGRPVGFIVVIVQNIGDDEKHERFELDGSDLTETKVLAFGVPPELRRRGIGRQLQLFAMEKALNQGCYQFRSRSDGDAGENHILKSGMGFAIQPAGLRDDTKSAFFVMPLRIWRDYILEQNSNAPDRRSIKQSTNLAIGEWHETTPGWDELVLLVESLGQTRWAFDSNFDWHIERHIYVATSGGHPVGYLLMVIQYIGDDDEHDRFELDGACLTEAKVMAFGVRPELRSQGIGRRLQNFGMAQARELGCHQFRSRSDGPAMENHILKTRMGFGIHPAARRDDNKSAFFIMPLKIWRGHLQ